MRYLQPIAVLIAIIAAGCSQSSPSPQKLPWTHHTLTEEQSKRQGQLLAEAWDLLAGTSASEHIELLSLADDTKNRGNETIYRYNVISVGDVHEPAHAFIVVANGKIKVASWPSPEY